MEDEPFSHPQEEAGWGLWDENLSGWKAVEICPGSIHTLQAQVSYLVPPGPLWEYLGVSWGQGRVSSRAKVGTLSGADWASPGFWEDRRYKIQTIPLAPFPQQSDH